MKWSIAIGALLAATALAGSGFAPDPRYPRADRHQFQRRVGTHNRASGCFLHPRTSFPGPIP